MCRDRCSFFRLSGLYKSILVRGQRGLAASNPISSRTMPTKSTDTSCRRALSRGTWSALDPLSYGAGWKGGVAISNWLSLWLLWFQVTHLARHSWPSAPRRSVQRVHDSNNLWLLLSLCTLSSGDAPPRGRRITKASYVTPNLNHLCWRLNLLM